MIKYAKITDEQIGLCEVGIGTNEAFYQSVGMTELDVCQSEVDNKWYLTDKCPQKTYEQKLLEAKVIKQQQNTEMAKQAVENGHVVFKNAEFETNAQTVGDLTATMLMLQAQQAVTQGDNQVAVESLSDVDSSASPQNDDLVLPQNEGSTASQNADAGELTYLWLSKDDKVVELSLSDFVTLGGLIAEFKNTIWQEKYIAYKMQIEQSQSLKTLANIELEY